MILLSLSRERDEDPTDAKALGPVDVPVQYHSRVPKTRHSISGSLDNSATPLQEDMRRQTVIRACTLRYNISDNGYFSVQQRLSGTVVLAYLHTNPMINSSEAEAGFTAKNYVIDEAHFWLNGYVNKQNCRIWSEANPQVYVETPLHPEKLTVWCALWAGGILLQKR
ncbi:uncharacterized protein TNCV_2535901 [Trichonephila clavipes]|nr:uncharacterized protein TNCV_2535901 [Trichonephila clavipes]